MGPELATAASAGHWHDLLEERIPCAPRRAAARERACPCCKPHLEGEGSCLGVAATQEQGS